MDLRPLKTSIKSILSNRAAHKRVGQAIQNRVAFITANNFTRRVLRTHPLPFGALPPGCQFRDGLYLFSENSSGVIRESYVNPVDVPQDSEELTFNGDVLSLGRPLGRRPLETLLVAHPFAYQGSLKEDLQEEAGMQPVRTAAHLEEEVVKALSLKEERLMYQNLLVHSDKYQLSPAFDPSPREFINGALGRFAQRFDGKLPPNTEILVSSELLMRIRGVIRDLEVSPVKWNSGYIGRWSSGSQSVPVFSDAGRPKDMRFMEEEDMLIYVGQEGGQITDRGFNPIDLIDMSADHMPGRGWVMSRTISMAFDLDKVLLARVA